MTKKIMYIPTTLTNFSYNYFPRLNFTPSSYFKMHKDVLGIFKEYPKYNFYFKLAPANNNYSYLHYNPIKEYKEFFYKSNNNIHFITKPLLECLKNNDIDLFIVDFSSTVILQVCTTDKPIITLVNENSICYTETAIKLLKKRAIVCEKVDEFYSEIKNFLDKEDFTNYLNDDSFLKAYGLPDFKEQPVKKIIDFLKNNSSLK